MKATSGYSKRLLPRIAKAKLLRLFATKSSQFSTELDTCAYVHAVSPHLEAPFHLLPFASTLDDPFGKGLRLLFAAPPQHGKTECVKHALTRLALKYPGKRHAYLTYNQNRADAIAFSFWQLAERVGLEPSGPKRDVRLKGGTEVKFRGMSSGLTGEPVDGIAIIDDPIKDAADAASVLKRDKAWEVWDSTIQTRLHPGAAVVVMATRWHVDDMTGRFQALGWPYINLKAICEDGDDDPLGREPGESLWEQRPPEFFADVQRNAPYTWAAMYQGRPRPIGGNVFNEPTFYSAEELPKNGFRIAHGIDLAYSTKSHADWSVCWTMIVKDGVYYVVDVLRTHDKAPDFARKLKTQSERWPGRMRWYGSTTEVGAGQLLGSLGDLRINAMLARGDKLVRAQPLAAAWNAGNIRLPRGTDDKPAPRWVHEVLGEFGDFTGVGDRHDDLIDAAAACFDELARSGAVTPHDPYQRLDSWDNKGVGF